MNTYEQEKNLDTLTPSTLENWRKFPNSKWAFHHVREIIPSAEIRNNPLDIWKLKEKEVPFKTKDLKSLINETSTDAVVIVQDNQIIFESYQNGMGADDQHIIFSISKSILALIAGCLIRDEIIRESDLITHYLPEMEGTAYDKATIRNALDMKVGVLFDEDYTAQKGPIIDYRYAANWDPTPATKESLTLKTFFTTLNQKDGPHNRNFHYVSPNTDLLAWVFERSTGKRYNDLVSDYLWKPLGSERPGYITLDRVGGMRAAGGICITARDLGRLGMLMANNGMRDQQQIIPINWILDIYAGGDRKSWVAGSFRDFFQSKLRHYRSQWYLCQEYGHLLHGFGIHGQYLFIDQERKLSVAWLSSEKDALNSVTTQKILSQITAIRKTLDKV